MVPVFSTSGNAATIPQSARWRAITTPSSDSRFTRGVVYLALKWRQVRKKLNLPEFFKVQYGLEF